MATPDMLDSISSAQQTFKTSDEQYLQERARCWITKLLGQELPDAVMALLLQNGRVLALVAEALEAACDGRGRMQQALSRSDLGPRRYHRQLDDINSFLQVCVRLGIAKDDLPALTDISRGTNVVATCRTLFALANKGTKLKVAGIPAFASVEEAAAARKSAMSRAHSSEKAKQFDQHSPHGDAHPAQRLSLERRCSGTSAVQHESGRDANTASAAQHEPGVDTSPCTTPHSLPTSLAASSSQSAISTPHLDPHSATKTSPTVLSDHLFEVDIDTCPCAAPHTLAPGLFRAVDSEACGSHARHAMPAGVLPPAAHAEQDAVERWPASAFTPERSGDGTAAQQSGAAASDVSTVAGEAGTAAAEFAALAGNIKRDSSNSSSSRRTPNEATASVHGDADCLAAASDAGLHWHRSAEAACSPAGPACRHSVPAALAAQPAPRRRTESTFSGRTPAAPDTRPRPGPSSRENDQSLSNQADGVPSVFQQSLRCRVASPAASPGLAFGPHSGKESEEGFSPCSTLDMYELQRHGSDTSSSSRSSASDEEPRTTGMQQGELPAEAKRKKQSQRSHRAWGRALLAAAAGLGAAVVGALVVGRHSRRRPAHYLVVEGDTLLQVLEQLAGGRATGEDALQRLLAKNPHLADNPDLIFPAQRIRL